MLNLYLTCIAGNVNNVNFLTSLINEMKGKKTSDWVIVPGISHSQANAMTTRAPVLIQFLSPSNQTLLKRAGCQWGPITGPSHLTLIDW